MKNENGRVTKANIKLIEYGNGSTSIENYFLQVGVVGLFCSEKELDDLYSVLNYYKNIEKIAECNLEFM